MKKMYTTPKTDKVAVKQQSAIMGASGTKKVENLTFTSEWNGKLD